MAVLRYHGREGADHAPLQPPMHPHADDRVGTVVMGRYGLEYAINVCFLEISAPNPDKPEFSVGYY